MRHIIKPLLRHPSMPLLVVIQVALACAIACNALFLLQQKLAPLTMPDGIGNPDRLLVITHLRARGKPWGAARLHAVQARLRQLPGVKAVSYAATLPMTDFGKMAANVMRPQGKTKARTSIYVGNNLLDTLDLHLLAGRPFTTSEANVTLGSGMGFFRPGPVIITRALARRLFPDGHALGRTLTFQHTKTRRTVVGVVAHLMRNQLDGAPRDNLDDSMLLPGVPKQWPAPRFVVRASAHADMQQLRLATQQVIHQSLGNDLLPGYTPTAERFSMLRQRMLAPATAAVWLFSGVTLIVLIVTLAGIMGMTSYWVRQRNKQIGIRRALGANRGAIFRAFQIENMLVVGAGAVLGMIAAYGINIWLMQHYALSRLPWSYLPVGLVLLLVLGQLAALAPTRRATRVPPIAATRAV